MAKLSPFVDGSSALKKIFICMVKTQEFLKLCASAFPSERYLQINPNAVHPKDSDPVLAARQFFGDFPLPLWTFF